MPVVNSDIGCFKFYLVSSDKLSGLRLASFLGSLDLYLKSYLSFCYNFVD